MRSARRLLVALCLLALPGEALAQSLQLRVESRELYAGLPFVLSLSAEGFEEQPEPEPPALEIAGSKVTYMGVTPNVSSMVTIVNGRRSESRRVSFVYRWRIETPQAGTYTIPSLTLQQGERSATSRPASFTTREVASTRDMRVSLKLPERPVWVGEVFDVKLDWFLKRDVASQSFSVPLFDMGDAIRVEPAPLRGRPTLAFPAGAQELKLPYESKRVSIGGQEYTRFRFEALATALRPGALELEPVKVAAQLEVGSRPDMFGFRVPRRQLFKAQDKPQRLSVRPLPLQGRPSSFEDAIGTAFSINVQASRTVAQLGEPIELAVQIRGNGRMEGLSLPRLDREGGLDPELFSIPDAAPVGELAEDGKSKTFRMTVRLKSAEAREIPPIEFSYFDPVKAEYRTVRSEPIALQVSGSTMVGAADVFSVPREAPSESEPADVVTPQPRPGDFATLVGADLALSPQGRTLRQALRPRDVRLLLLGLYGLPCLVLGWRIWSVRTEARRGYGRRLRADLRAVKQAVEKAASVPAREAAPGLLSALRGLARSSGRSGTLAGPLIERLETQAFDPRAAQEPLPETVRSEVLELAEHWVSEARDRNSSQPKGAALLLVLLLAGLAGPASAEPVEERLGEARALYQQALQEQDRVRRTRLFAQAERLLRDVVAARGDRPELLADWGNAALGAQDLGRATLAYRRALALEPTHQRALTNLQWLRSRAPGWLPRPSARGALDSLFFWHHRLSRTQRHLIAAGGFGLALLLLAPWALSDSRTRLLRRLAVPALLVWLAATISILAEPGATRDGVVMLDGAVLRSADSLGAPPVLSAPLPAGAEVRLEERRGGWTRIALADGTRGWVKTLAVEPVVP